MAAVVRQLVPRVARQATMQRAILTDVVIAERLSMVDRAQLAADEAWDRVMMTADGGEPEQGAVLDYEMAINDLLEAKAKAGL